MTQGGGPERERIGWPALWIVLAVGGALVAVLAYGLLDLLRSDSPPMVLAVSATVVVVVWVRIAWRWLGSAGDEVWVEGSRLRVRSWLDALRDRPERIIELRPSTPAVFYSRSRLWIGEELVHPVGRGAFDRLLAVVRDRGVSVEDRTGASTRSWLLGCLAAILFVGGAVVVLAVAFSVQPFSGPAAFTVGWLGLAAIVAAPLVFLRVSQRGGR